MLKKLRWRVVALTMIAVSIVLVILMGAVNLVNYVSRDNAIDEVLDLLAENGGSFIMLPGGHGGHGGHGEFGVMGEDLGQEEGNLPFDMSPPEDLGDIPDKPDGEEGRFDLRPGMSEETPYETRFFSVTLNGSGEISNMDITNIAAVSQDEAQDMATSAYRSEKEYSYIKTSSATYKYKRALTESGDTLFIFVDCSRDIDSVKSFLLTSILVSLVGLVAIGILVIILSPAMVKPIVESYEKQKKFITNAGHELKTPLAVISSCAEVVELENGESKWTNAIHEQVGRMSDLTGKLVSLAKMDEAADGGQNFETQDINFSELIKETLDPFSLVASQKGLSLEVNLPESGDVSIKGNKAYLTELVNILADNAIKYSIPEGTVKFTLSQNGKKIVLTEENQAEGLTPGSQNALLDRFYRGDQSHSKSQEDSKDGGYGIGLSMAQSIVNAHGGKIEAISPDGKTFRITAEF